ncbi:MAG: 16S rRNA (adenine(1518)-N(6)/adenine(1519)-N(6))-dimethyltransferase RsmA [Burkholderiales bacterium]|nr:16S rRNA (adenine(1518)-N(6)/adenine(1519)-N(6))-dimethyltransferase RsmA [Burkholderiales bacterium]
MKHIPRKRFGQNFLQDQSIIRRIIECINPQKGQRIVEIGPGLAALTEPLIDQMGHIDVVELDRDIINILEKKFLPEQITIHSGDALKMDFSFENDDIRVVGNLPYNISTPIMFHLSTFSNISNMVFMLQKEVVERICAQPNTSDYGRLTVMLQYKFKCRYLLDVPPESFYPAPKVDSAIVSLTPRTDYDFTQVNEEKLSKVVSTAFNQRRKTISNSLKSMFSGEQLINCGIDLKSRPENITIEQYITLSEIL